LEDIRRNIIRHVDILAKKGIKRRDSHLYQVYVCQAHLILRWYASGKGKQKFFFFLYEIKQVFLRVGIIFVRLLSEDDIHWLTYTDYLNIFGCELDGSLYYLSPRPKPAIKVLKRKGDLIQVWPLGNHLIKLLHYKWHHAGTVFQLGPKRLILHKSNNNTSSIISLRNGCSPTSGSDTRQISKMDDYHYEVVVDRIKGDCFHIYYFIDNDGRIIGWPRGNYRVDNLKYAFLYAP
jgi:hypothetical protein